MLNFTPITLKDKLVVQRYAFPYGENSCQHSFANLYCLKDKYKTEICEDDGFLFIHHASKDDETFRSYLMPMGSGEIRLAVQAAMEDAHERGYSLKFDTVTEASAKKLSSLFPGRFNFEERRDMAEYLYTSEKLAGLKGPEMVRRRYDIHRYERCYGAKTTVAIITEEDLPAVRTFQAKWLEARLGSENAEIARSLINEDAAISLALTHYEELELSGILISIDSELAGYTYGCRISNDCFDTCAEKGSREICGISHILNRELTLRCCEPLCWINREEDLGVEGMRKAKMSYHPDIIMPKFVVRESQ